MNIAIAKKHTLFRMKLELVGIKETKIWPNMHNQRCEGHDNLVSPKKGTRVEKRIGELWMEAN
jgi:hypothetical protein